MLTIDRFSNQHEYREFCRRSEPELRRRFRLEQRLAAGQLPFTVAGHCDICAREVAFAVDFEAAGGVSPECVPNWRERVICPSCGLNARMRAAVCMAKAHLPHDQGPIYVTERKTPLFAALESLGWNIVGSEYLGDQVELGGRDATGVRNEDLTRLTFPSGSFGGVISLDVLEHVPDYGSALGELARVLVEGGGLLLSAPFRADRTRHLVRARRANDEIEYLEPPEHHDDPTDPAGCLAWYHFGWEILENLRAAGFSGARACLYWSERLGCFGPEQFLFEAMKTPR